MNHKKYLCNRKKKKFNGIFLIFSLLISCNISVNLFETCFNLRLIKTFKSVFYLYFFHELN